MTWTLTILFFGTETPLILHAGHMVDEPTCELAGQGMVTLLAMTTPGVAYGWTCAPVIEAGA